MVALAIQVVDVGNQDTIGAAGGPQVDLAAPRQLLANPVDGLRVIGGIHHDAGQLNAVGAVAVTDLQERATAHLQDLGRVDGA